MENCGGENKKDRKGKQDLLHMLMAKIVRLWSYTLLKRDSDYCFIDSGVSACEMIQQIKFFNISLKIRQIHSEQ